MFWVLLSVVVLMADAGRRWRGHLWEVSLCYLPACSHTLFLPLQLEKPEWAPDFGPPTFVPQWGATVTGARTFLIAYNINLLCTKELAHRIALNIREQGRGADQVPLCCPLPCLSCPGLPSLCFDHNGLPQPGSLKKVQGIGWYLEEENIAQVSTNLLDFETTPLHAVYEEVCCNAEVGSAQCSCQW